MLNYLFNYSNFSTITASFIFYLIILFLISKFTKIQVFRKKMLIANLLIIIGFLILFIHASFTAYDYSSDARAYIKEAEEKIYTYQKELYGDIQTLNNDLIKLESAANQLQIKHRDNKALLDKLEQTKEKLKDALEELKPEIERLQKQKQAIDETIKYLKEEYNLNEKRIKEINTELTQNPNNDNAVILKLELEKLTKRQIEITNEIKALKIERETLGTKIYDLQKKYEKKYNKYQEILKIIQNIEVTEKQLKDQIDRYENRIHETKNQIEKNEQLIKELKQIIDDLNALKTSFASNRGAHDAQSQRNSGWGFANNVVDTTGKFASNVVEARFLGIVGGIKKGFKITKMVTATSTVASITDRLRNQFMNKKGEPIPMSRETYKDIIEEVNKIIEEQKNEVNKLTEKNEQIHKNNMELLQPENQQEAQNDYLNKYLEIKEKNDDKLASYEKAYEDTSKELLKAQFEEEETSDKIKNILPNERQHNDEVINYLKETLNQNKSNKKGLKIDMSKFNQIKFQRNQSNKM